MKDEKKKIAIVAAYGGCNLGDDSIINTCISFLQNKYKIDLYGFFDNRMYWKDNKSLNCDKAIYLYDARVKNILNFLKLLFNKNYYKLIFIGGGYNFFLNSRVLLLLLLLARKSKSIYFTGQTIMKFNNKFKNCIFSSILRKAEIIGVREKYSYNLLYNYKNVMLTGDDIFLDIYEKNNKISEEYVVINIKSYPDLEEINHKMENIIVEALVKIRKKVIIIPFNNTKDCVEMRNIELFCDRLIRTGLDAKVVVPTSIDELCNILASAKLCIGNAYHFVAYCIKTNSNFLTWYDKEYYYKKIKGIIDLFGIRNVTIDVNNENKAIQQVIDSYGKKTNFNIKTIHKNVKKCWELITRGDD